MSLVGTLAKVAVGVAAAKGIGYVLNQRASAGGSFDGGHFGGATTAPPTAPGAQPGLGDLLSSVLGGKGQAGGGLGDLLEQLAAGANKAPGATTPGSGGGLDVLLKGLADAVSGAGAASSGTVSKPDAGTSFGNVLNQSFQNLGEPKIAPTPHQDAAAGLMLRAMLQAAKSDGQLDDGEKKKLVEVLGDASPEDMAFVNRELAAPVDVQALVRQVPKGLEKQIYTVSVLGVDLDSQAEAKYLAELASAMSLSPSDVNAIHAQFGVPALYH